MTPDLVETLLSPAALVTALSQGALFLLWLAAALLFYGWLADRVVLGANPDRPERLGPFDAAVALGLTALMLPIVAAFFSALGTEAVHEAKLPDTRTLIVTLALNDVVYLTIVAVILAGLAGRRIRWREVFGFCRVGAGGVLGLAALLLAFALPLIGTGLVLSQLALAALGHPDDSKQELVQILAASPSSAARLAVALTAIIFAPFQEELIFRGYLYGVVRRYAGVTAGILFNATLFAIIHLHAPSFGGLFVLAVCLTLAYEWTGSILVPMVMHALFNSLSVISLLHGTSL